MEKRLWLDPTRIHPMSMPDGTAIPQVVYLNQVIDHPRMEIGDFSYYHNFEVLEDYASALAPYLFPLSPEKLVIGKFCQIAHGVRFVTSSANHDMSGFSTYPFSNFTMAPDLSEEDLKALFNIPGRKGDTVVGHDVWIGMEAMILPGVTIGDGAIIGARSVVTRDVAPYQKVAGNPAQERGARFAPDVIAALQKMAWWHWPTETIKAHLAAITGADLAALTAVAERVAADANQA